MHLSIPTLLRRLTAALLTLGVSLGFAHAKPVFLDMDVELDQVAPEDAKMYRVGGHDLDRIGYDDAALDPVAHKVQITYLAHFIGGHWIPTSPTESSSLDLSAAPYRLDLISAVSHGRDLVVVFESASRRMAILARPDFHVLIAGKYTISSTKLTAAQAKEPPANANSPSTMPMMSGMPPMPHDATPPPSAAAPSTETAYGQLLDNPVSHAVLLKLIPEVVNNPQSQMGRDLPLKAIAQFEPTLTPEKLHQLDEALASASK